jgi:hypothetical protein
MVGLIVRQLFKLSTCFLSGDVGEKGAHNVKARGSGWCCKHYAVLKPVYSEQLHGTGYLPIFRILQEKLGFIIIMVECLCACASPPPPCYILKQLTSFLLPTSEHDATREHPTLVRLNSLLRRLSY